MTDRLYTDPDNAASVIKETYKSLDSLEDTQHIEIAEFGQPVPGFDEDEMEDAGLPAYRDEHVTIDVGTSRTELIIHQSVVENPLELVPADRGTIDARQVTQPRELSSLISRLLAPLEAELGLVRWDLAEIEAQSIANPGHLTDYVYTYVGTFGELDPFEHTDKMELTEP